MNKKLAFILLSSILSITPAFATTTNLSESSNIYQNSLPDFSGIYDMVGKSVVNINVVTASPQVNNPFGGSGDPMFDYFFKRMLPPQQQNRQQRGLGSGFILSSDGYVLTNAHVVKDAQTVTVKLSDKREFKAKVIGLDTATDVAILKINANNLAPVKIGNPNQLKPGNWVVAIGSPFGLENTITQGIVSALSRNLPDDSAVPFIQSDVPVNPGNSGGPLINLRGEVVGINSQIYSKSGGYMGISFAIPIDYAMRIADQLKTTGKVVHGRLGIAIQPVTDDLAASFGLSSAKGALVNSVDSASAAEKAGIQVGDVILSANGQEIGDSTSLQQIISNLGAHKEVKLVIWRNNQRIVINAITMAADSNINDSKSQDKSSSTTELKKIGVTVVPLSASQLKPFSNRVSYALAVQSISQINQLSGLAVGDIIIGVANTSITSLAQLEKILASYKPGQRIALKVVRSNGAQFITLFIPMSVQ